MATVCDACGEKYGRHDGTATIRVSPSMPTTAQILSGGGVPQYREAQEFDLCLPCMKKALASLGLPTESCDPPITAADEEPVKPAGLGIGDLLQLHAKGDLADADLQALGVKLPPKP
jgi:hypothetical protein